MCGESRFPQPDWLQFAKKAWTLWSSPGQGGVSAVNGMDGAFPEANINPSYLRCMPSSEF